MATYYVDGAAGSDGAAGTSFGTAFATIGKAASVVADGDRVRICNTTTYVLTSTVTWTVVGTPANGGVIVSGADSSGNLLTASGTPPTITSSTNSVALFTLTGALYLRFQFLKFTHTAGTKGDAFQCLTSGPSIIALEGITVDGCATGWNANGRDAGGLTFSDCFIGNCSSVGIANGAGAGAPSVGVMLRDVVLYNNGAGGYSNNGNSGQAIFHRCIIAKNTGKGIYDLGGSRNITFIINGCTIVDNTSDGIRSDESTGIFQLIGERNIIWGNGGYGVDVTTQTAVKSDTYSYWKSNFYGSNTSGDLNNISAGANDVTGVADPFTSRAGKDWSLNATGGAGALVRAAGYPATYRGTSTNNNLDGGAAQHLDSGGGGTLIVVED